MTLADLRGVLDRALAELPAAEVPAFIGILASVQASACVRLPAVTAAAGASAPTTMLSAEQVAAALGVKASAVYEWARAGRIPVEKFGRFRRFDLAAVRQALTTSNPKTVYLGAQNPRREVSTLRGTLSARLPENRGAARAN